MTNYEKNAHDEAFAWYRNTTKPPSMTATMTKQIQYKMNRYIPQKVHDASAQAVKAMIETVLSSSTTFGKIAPVSTPSLKEADNAIEELAAKHRNIATAEGAGTGAGGLFLGMVDFPALLSIKFRFLWEAAQLYGFDPSIEEERLFLVHVFQSAFSAPQQKAEAAKRIREWETWIDNIKSKEPPENWVDWTLFQEGYRDAIDLPKLLQLVPGFGAVVGAVVNRHFLTVLADAAKQSYRFRLLPSETNKKDLHR
ncbi:EcsC family protein [Salsuginibacillus kocurii]|uniref:EcsC family protein n=1 Tax=Salsuginibacillus kocurii TaxID=427078 RepID=UPI0003764296|nr:EcsC family protein [Salsuginibacillus kocurii]